MKSVAYLLHSEEARVFVADDLDEVLDFLVYPDSGRFDLC